jgi:hypothetical protein
VNAPAAAAFPVHQPAPRLEQPVAGRVTPAIDGQVSHAGILPSGVRLLLPLLCGAALVEFLVLRTFLRMGPLLPTGEALLPIYWAIQTAGIAAMNLAVLCAAALAATVAVRLLTGAGISVPGTRPSRAADVLLALLILAAVAANLALGGLQETGTLAGAAVVQSAVSAAALLAIAAVSLRRASTGLQWSRQRLPLMLIVGAQSLALYHVFSEAVVDWAWTLPGREWALIAAEALAVGAALSLPWSYRPPFGRRHLLAGLLLGLALLAVLAARPWTFTTISMWTVAFSFSLPGVIYVAALAAAAATVWALYGAGVASRTAALGLLLVAVAGLKLEFTYLTLLALAGVLILSQIGARPAPPVPAV